MTIHSFSFCNLWHGHSLQYALCQLIDIATNTISKEHFLFLMLTIFKIQNIPFILLMDRLLIGM